MADTTLQALSDDIALLYQSQDDMKVILDDHDAHFQTVDDDIAALETPTIGVPPSLLSWFSLAHTITEVDTILDSDITAINSTLSGHTTAISDLVNDVSDEVTDRTNADNIIDSTVSDLQTQVTTNLGTLTQEISDRSALSASSSAQYILLNDRIDDVVTDLSDLTTNDGTAITTLESQVAVLSAGLQTANSQITLLRNIGVDPLAAQAANIAALSITANSASSSVTNEATLRSNADLALQTNLDSVNSSLSGFQTSLDAETNTRAAADSSINIQIGSLGATVASHTGLISAETAARVAADSTLTTNVATNTGNIATNTSNIATEIADRANADSVLNAAIIINSSSIGTNTTNIATHTTELTGLKSHFGVVKDGGGYVTGYRINDDTTAASNFNLRTLNNDLKLQNPGYVGKYFPAIAISSFQLPDSYDTQYGAGASNLFRGLDANDYTAAVNVYATGTVALNGSVFKAVDYNVGGDLNRLGQDLTTFLVKYSGYVNKYLSLWYRIKLAPGDTTQRWFPVSMANNLVPSPRTYELVSKQEVVQISVGTTGVIEFGLTTLNTLNASISDAANDVIYGGSVTIEALNLITIL